MWQQEIRVKLTIKFHFHDVRYHGAGDFSTCFCCLCVTKTTPDARKSQSATRPAIHLKASPYSITERRVSELIPVLGSQPAGDVSHKPGGRLPLLSARPAVTPATLKRAATILLLGEQRHDGCEQFA